MARLIGIFSSLPPDVATARLSEMGASMLRGPAETLQILSVPESGCCIGWVTEAESGGAGSPIVYEQGDEILVFSGEHFGNDHVITSDHRSNDRQQPLIAALLRSLSSASGDQALRALNGWFAGIYIDTARKRAVLFNDRFGMHRIYYTQSDGFLAVATEAKALLATQPDARLQPEGLGEFLVLGSVLNNRTIFDGVLTLPGGSAWTIGPAGLVEQRRYFSADEWEAQSTLPADEFGARLDDAFARAVPKYFRGIDAPAVSLTGGLDTRVIMAFAGAGASAASYTFAGMYRDCYDVRIARDVARACGSPHSVLRIGPQFLADFGQHAEATIWLTDGTLDIRSAHEVYLHEMAAKISSVRITGNYGSELFRGARTFRPVSVPEQLFVSELRPHLQQAARSFDSVAARHPVSFAAFAEVPCHLFGRLSAAQSRLTLRSPFTDNDLVALAYRAPADVRSAAGLWNRLISNRDPRLASIPTDRGHVTSASAFRTLPNRLYNYLLFKAEWYYESGMPHWLAGLDLRYSGRARRPFFAGSHKIESYRRWFRDEVFDYLHSVLDGTGSETPWIDRNRSRQVLNAHREGRGNYVHEINKLVTITLIHKLLVRPHRIMNRTMAAPVRTRLVRRTGAVPAGAARA